MPEPRTVTVPSIETSTYESWEVRARGVTWEGLKGTFYAAFDHQPTQQDIKASSGDFQRLEKIFVIHSTRTVREERSISSVA